MAQTILITPEELRNRARQLRSYASQDEEIIQRLTNLIISIDEVWKGEAQTAFLNRYQNARSLFRDFNSALNDFSAMMDTTADRMENADITLRNRINSIN